MHHTIYSSQRPEEKALFEACFTGKESEAREVS